jgi:alpha-beta hydrolase superfamily lysophospholipase
MDCLVGSHLVPSPGHTWRGATFVVLVLAVSSHLAGRASAAPQRVTFRSGDGVTLAATWYEPATRPAPSVILVHMLQKSRRDWDRVASTMAAEGIGALAFDLRGHGESQGNAQDYAGMVQDVHAARRYLATRSDAAAGRIGLAGASLGATLAAQASSDDPSIATVVLLSPSLDYRGLRIEPAMRKFGARPVLLVASDDDGYAARTIRDLQKAGGGIRESLVLSRAGHGTAMLERDPDLARRLVEWFRRTLL